jgi:hypothetical protein
MAILVILKAIASLFLFIMAAIMVNKAWKAAEQENWQKGIYHLLLGLIYGLIAFS